MPLRGVGPLSGGYGVPTFESRTQSIPPTTQNAGRHFSKYRETPHSGQGCGVRKKNHDSHFLSSRLTILYYVHTFSHRFVLGARLQGPLGRFAGTGRVMEASEQVSRQRREMRLSLIGALSHLSRARYRYTPSG